MTQSQQEANNVDSGELFDKYTLPKIALVIILFASFVGTYVTLALVGTESIPVVVAKWGYLVSLGVLVGGLCWKHVFVRPADLKEGTTEYCERMYSRFDRIAGGSVLLLVVTGSVVVNRYWQSTVETELVWAVTGLLIGLVTVLGYTSLRSTDVTHAFRSSAGITALTFAVLLLLATAAAEVVIRAESASLLAVRGLHLIAFAIWVGGAVWNIFVAVPTGQQSPTLAVVGAAGQQLERFRWAVRFVIPIILVTGLYQAYAGLGTNYGVYLTTVLGNAVLLKLGVIGVLVLIFKLCPMWRACSPIDGVCDLEEMNNPGSDNNTEVAADD